VSDADDTEVVSTAAEAAALVRPPLVVLEHLQHWLDQHGLGTGPVTASRLPGGHSNVTVLIRREGLEVVLRRPPRPPLPPGAHDIIREARVLCCLEATEVPTPRILASCESDAVLGAPFVLMEYVRGEVIGSELPPWLERPVDRRAAAEAFIDSLVMVHSVDIGGAGLSWLGRPGHYLERQLRRFSSSWEINRTRPLRTMTELERALRAGLHPSEETTLIHGDARLGNALFAPGPPVRLAALLDWEMATIGDPIADLGYLCAAWTDVGQTEVPMFHLSPATSAEGFPPLAQLIDRYERRSGRRVDRLEWYTAMACWKSAVFMEGNYRRAVNGGSDDPFALGFRTGVEELAERGLSLLRA